MTRDEIYRAFYSDQVARGFLHSHSYTGNPLACRAALATLDIFAQDNVLAANRDKAAYLNGIAQPLREHRAVHGWRNIGKYFATAIGDMGHHVVPVDRKSLQPSFPTQHFFFTEIRWVQKF